MLFIAKCGRFHKPSIEPVLPLFSKKSMWITPWLSQKTVAIILSAGQTDFPFGWHILQQISPVPALTIA